MQTQTSYRFASAITDNIETVQTLEEKNSHHITEKIPINVDTQTDEIDDLCIIMMEENKEDNTEEIKDEPS